MSLLQPKKYEIWMVILCVYAAVSQKLGLMTGPPYAIAYILHTFARCTSIVFDILFFAQKITAMAVHIKQLT